VQKDPAEMSAEELEGHIAELTEDLDDVVGEEAFLRRQTSSRMPGHQLERYETQIGSLKRRIEEAEALLAGLRGGGAS
jgi:predicted  nucleic acid-binding Zn-ribbon protein